MADRQNLFFIAFVDADAAGYVYAEVVQQRETSRHYAYSMIYIQQISVRTQFQGLGVGKALMSVVQSAGEDIGVTILALDV